MNTPEDFEDDRNIGTEWVCGRSCTECRIERIWRTQDHGIIVEYLPEDATHTVNLLLEAFLGSFRPKEGQNNKGYLLKQRFVRELAIYLTDEHIQRLAEAQGDKTKYWRTIREATPLGRAYSNTLMAEHVLAEFLGIELPRLKQS